MPPSAKELRDLVERTPPVLRQPEAGPADDSGPKGALMRWAAARGFNPPEAVRISIRDEGDDEIVGAALVGNVAVMALVHQLQLEVELERTTAIENRKREGQRQSKGRTIEDVEFLAHMRRLDPGEKNAYTPRLRLSKLTKQALDALEEHRAKIALERSKLADYLEQFTALKQQISVPIVASGYMNQPQRSALVGEKTIMLDFITRSGIKLARALAMIGELRNGDVPVDVHHPQLDKIYDRHKFTLRQLRGTLKKARERFAPSQRNPSLGVSGKKRHKRQRKVNAKKGTKKR